MVTLPFYICHVLKTINMKAQIIVLAGLLFAGLSNIKAEENELQKKASASITTVISGTITDATTGENLVGVKVLIEELNHVVYTDFDGRFEFSPVKNGTYTVLTDYVSYQDEKPLSVNAGKTCNLNIALKAEQ